MHYALHYSKQVFIGLIEIEYFPFSMQQRTGRPTLSTQKRKGHCFPVINYGIHIRFHEVSKLFVQCSVSSLHLLHLNKSFRDSPEGVQASMLRRLAKVPHPYISHISSYFKIQMPPPAADAQPPVLVSRFCAPSCDGWSISFAVNRPTRSVYM